VAVKNKAINTGAENHQSSLSI